MCGFLIAVAACRRPAVEEQPGIFGEGLAGAAWKTHRDYIRDLNKEKKEFSEKIPERYWADEIKALNPVEVYIHRVNIVVVEKVSGGVEHGRYIYIPISSYMPMSGDDGFEFSDAKDSVYKYKRKRTVN